MQVLVEVGTGIKEHLGVVIDLIGCAMLVKWVDTGAIDDHRGVVDLIGCAI